MQWDKFCSICNRTCPGTEGPSRDVAGLSVSVLIICKAKQRIAVSTVDEEDLSEKLTRLK